MDKCIHPAGFHDWDKPISHDTVFYAEYDSYGKGGCSNVRAPFARILTKEAAHSFTIPNILGFPLP